MIDIIPNISSFRRVPFQSGNYSIELDINLSNHLNDVTFILSGGGSTFFSFGSNSGSYYASGNNKLYFDSTMPNTDLTYTFIINNSSFDVYKDSSPLILNGVKNTGICEKIFTNTTTNADGQFSLILRGNRPSFNISSGMIFPINGTNIDNIIVTNNTTVPFYLLSGTLDTINFVSMGSQFPTFINANNSGTITFSGHLDSISDEDISFILNTDFVNLANVLTITGTNFSGSGYSLSAPVSQTTTFGAFANALWLLSNTGTVPLKFSPTISKMVTGIQITPPTYSGVNLKNYFSGYFDTPSQFYFSDKITWSGGAFHIIEQNNTGLGVFNITGDNPTGLYIGTLTNVAAGETFVLPYDFQITGLSAKLATNDSGFFGSDIVYIGLYQGSGVSGTLLSTSSPILCSNIPLTLESGQYFQFLFPTAISLKANNLYTISLSGNPNFAGNVLSVPPRQIFIFQTTGKVFEGSGFYYNGTTHFTTGNTFFQLNWMPPLNSSRYLVNIVSGTATNFQNVYTGIYDKYQGYLSFSFANNNIQAFPNSPISFVMTYTGLSSGMNFAQLNFNELGYSTIISGFTI